MKRILVVEDETNIALGLEDDLTLEGYSVVLARDGDEAIRVAREQPFDLIVLDLMLPRKDGFTVCRELRHRGLNIPIIMLTARTQEAEKVLGLEMGADDYVTKPFSPIELRARIKAVLRRAGEATDVVPKVYRFGDTEVDFGRCELRRGDRTLDVTSIELKLLEAFIRNRGRVLTRDQLLDAGWGTGTNVTDRAVDNHVVALRRKIEPDPAEPRYLYSVRGIGYRFDG
ncbi:MAG: response regulator transcription factor [Acidobacteria bacterium]|nr:response regulator transcription factor [Acidobacteriota bacterium]